ncbi:hypothetical protein ACIP5Z_07100 [Rothia terrae]|uniref:hypothetical protein n=1 Tax=Rothia terrae TaxID=396015 RepID=UPI0038269DE6
MSESPDKEPSALPIGICGIIASLGMLGMIFFRLPAIFMYVELVGITMSTYYYFSQVGKDY